MATIFTVFCIAILACTLDAFTVRTRSVQYPLTYRNPYIGYLTPPSYYDPSLRNAMQSPYFYPRMYGYPSSPYYRYDLWRSMYPNERLPSARYRHLMNTPFAEYVHRSGRLPSQFVNNRPQFPVQDITNRLGDQVPVSTSSVSDGAANQNIGSILPLSDIDRVALDMARREGPLQLTGPSFTSTYSDPRLSQTSSNAPRSI